MHPANVTKGFPLQLKIRLTMWIRVPMESQIFLIPNEFQNTKPDIRQIVCDLGRSESKVLIRYATPSL